MKRFIGIITVLVLSFFCITAVNAEGYSDNAELMKGLEIFSGDFDKSENDKVTRADFINNINRADKVILDSAVSFSYDDWTSYIDEYKKLGIHSVYHSHQYHKREMPAYNVISRKYVYLIPVL